MISGTTTIDSDVSMKYKRDIYFFIKSIAQCLLQPKSVFFILLYYFANEDHDKEHPLTKSKPFTNCGFRLHDFYP